MPASVCLAFSFFEYVIQLPLSGRLETYLCFPINKRGFSGFAIGKPRPTIPYHTAPMVLNSPALVRGLRRWPQAQTKTKYNRQGVKA
jgi:transposase